MQRRTSSLRRRWLRKSVHAGNATFDSVREMAVNSTCLDPNGYRSEFVQLVERARVLNR
jgi:hypothetical protein